MANDAPSDKHARLNRQLTELESIPIELLKARWLAIYRVPVPKKARADFLRQVLACHLQEQCDGGFRPATLRRLQELTQSTLPSISAARQPIVSSGSELIREWNGHIHRVMVQENGFFWNGQHYRSLSAVAMAITGTHWSGPRFFGLAASATPAGRK
jgi:hypothetical protein